MDSWKPPVDAVKLDEGDTLTAWYSPGFQTLYFVDSEDPDCTYLIATFVQVTDEEMALAYCKRHLS